MVLRQRTERGPLAKDDSDYAPERPRFACGGQQRAGSSRDQHHRYQA